MTQIHNLNDYRGIITTYNVVDRCKNDADR